MSYITDMLCVQSAQIRMQGAKVRATCIRGHYFSYLALTQVALIDASCFTVPTSADAGPDLCTLCPDRCTLHTDLSILRLGCFPSCNCCKHSTSPVAACAAWWCFLSEHNIIVYCIARIQEIWLSIISL